jgi:hypothetical protein
MRVIKCLYARIFLLFFNKMHRKKEKSLKNQSFIDVLLKK